MTRLNQFIAGAAGLSRRAADEAIVAGRVRVNAAAAILGQQVSANDVITLDGQKLAASTAKLYLVFNKPTGYVCSRRSQGQSPTIYSLLPTEFHGLKSAGRLDKNSSGLLLLTNDGQLAQALIHPRHGKLKQYYIELNRRLNPKDQKHIEAGIKLDDGPSRLQLESKGKGWLITMSEGRNRQIRRTFATAGYGVTLLNRISLGKLTLGRLKPGEYKLISRKEIT